MYAFQRCDLNDAIFCCQAWLDIVFFIVDSEDSLR